MNVLSKTSTVADAKFAARRKVPVELVARAMSVYTALADELFKTVTGCGVFVFHAAMVPSRVPKMKLAEPLLGMSKMLEFELNTVPAGVP